MGHRGTSERMAVRPRPGRVGFKPARVKRPAIGSMRMRASLWAAMLLASGSRRVDRAVETAR